MGYNARRRRGAGGEAARRRRWFAAASPEARSADLRSAARRVCARRGEFRAEAWSLTKALGVRRGLKSDARGQQ